MLRSGAFTRGAARVSWSVHDDAAMKRSTAMSRLSDIADALDRAVQWSEVTVVAGYVFGSMLEPEAEIERIELAFVVAEPPEVVPWMARPVWLLALAYRHVAPKALVSALNNTSR
jgi:hypothetical protein